MNHAPTSRKRCHMRESHNLDQALLRKSAQLVDLSDFEEDLKNAFLSELKGRIGDELGELIGSADGGRTDWDSGEGDLGLGGPHIHKMLPPSLMNGFNGVDDARNRY